MLEVTPHPSWVAQLDALLEPVEQQILDLPVVADAARNALDESAVQRFCTEFYPIIRDFPQWLEVLLGRSPPGGEGFFRDNIRVERRHAEMWRVMGERFGIPADRFEQINATNAPVQRFHDFLTDIGANGPFASAVAATNYAAEGVTQKISAKALEGQQHNERLGERGRWWLEDHAKYDDEHPVLALEVIKSCVAGGTEDPQDIQGAAVRSLELLRDAMDASYHP